MNNKTVDIDAKSQIIIKKLLQQYLPNTEIWAYGSRVKWTATPQSDLDLVAFTTAEQKPALFTLKEAFEESNLPFRVDLFCWDEIPEQFQNNIKQEKVILNNVGWVSDSVTQQIEAENVGLRDKAANPTYGTGHWTTIGEIAEVFDGPHATPKKIDQGAFFLSISSLEGGMLDLSKSAHLSEDDFKKWTKRVTPREGDVLFSYETRLGEAALMPPDIKACLGRRMGLLRPKQDKVIPEYLLYAYLSPAFQSIISSRTVHGCTVDRIALKDLPSFIIRIPSVPEQRQAVKVLRSLDLKIELNTQVNQTLEQMAQALFKSWFVDFDPVKAKIADREADGTAEQANLAAMQVISSKTEAQLEVMKTQQPEQYKELKATAELFPDAMKDSELGDVPVGWEVSEIGKEVTIVGGGTPSTKNPDFWENGALHWTTPKDLSNLSDKILIETSRKVTEKGLAKISSGLLPIDTVLMSSRAPVGYLALAKIPVAVNQGYIAMKCEKTLSSEYVIQWCDSIMNDIKQRASGTTFAEISKKNFKVIPLVVPSQVLIKNYSDKASSLYQQVENNLKESQSLTQLRDTLLPKLLSGALVSGGVGGSPTYEPKARAGCEKGA